MIRSCLIRCALVIALVALGCTKNGPKIVAIEGVATHNGTPVPNLMIWFEPASGRPSWGISDSKGHFVLDYDPDYDGAVVGSHTVWVLEDPSLNDPTAMMGKAKPKRPPEMQAVLDKYGSKEKSPLKVEVKKADRNFPLKLD
jgi:hypothetical protein